METIKDTLGNKHVKSPWPTLIVKNGTECGTALYFYPPSHMLEKAFHISSQMFFSNLRLSSQTAWNANSTRVGWHGWTKGCSLLPAFFFFFFFYVNDKSTVSATSVSQSAGRRNMTGTEENKPALQEMLRETSIRQWVQRVEGGYFYKRL